MSFRDSSCTGKVRYPSKHRAKQEKKRIQCLLGGRPMKNMRPYRCSFCLGFHIGHSDNEIPLTELDQIAISLAS